MKKEQFLKFNFATSSDIKYGQYRAIFNDFGYDIEKSPKLDESEPQVNDEIPSNLQDFKNEIRKDKIKSLVEVPLKSAASKLGQKRYIKNYLVEDTFLIIDAFTNQNKIITELGLPGADTKNWWLNLGNEGVLKLMEKSSNRSASFSCVLGCYLNIKSFSNRNYVISHFSVDGQISFSPRESKESIDNFPITNPYSFHKIFIPDGHEKTYAEMGKDEFMQSDYRRKNAEHFIRLFEKRLIESEKEIEKDMEYLKEKGIDVLNYEKSVKAALDRKREKEKKRYGHQIILWENE